MSIAWRRIVRSQLPPLGLPADREADIVEEIAQQLEQTYDAAREQGRDHDEALGEAMAVVKSWPRLAQEIERAERSSAARAAARIAAPVLHEPTASGRIGTLIREAWQDAGHGLRVFGRHRGFACTAIVTLALAIGANTAIFSLVHTVLLKPLPFPEADRLAVVYEGLPAMGIDEMPFAAPDLAHFEAAQRSYDSLGAFREAEFELGGDGPGVRVQAARITAGLFETLRIAPALGRLFTPEEDAPGHDLVILSHGLWRDRFGADPAVIGRTLLLDRRPYTIVGVMPAGFGFPMRLPQAGPPASIFVPMAFTAEQLADRASGFNHRVIARLRPGVTWAAAQAEVDTIIATIFERYPVRVRTRVANARLIARVVPLQDESAAGVRPVLLLLLATVGALLLIGCANVSNLLLVLATGRRKELALRVSLGASRGRVLRQLLVESAVLAAIGGVAGLALAWALIRLAPSILPPDTPRLDELTLNGSVLAFTALVSLGTALVFGLAPGLQASRTDMRSVLADSARGSTSRGAQRLRSGLVVSQCAIAIVLLVAAGLLLRTFLGLMNMNPGFRPEHALAATTYLPLGGYRTADDLRRFYREAIARGSALPGVTRAGLSTDLPLAPTERRGIIIENWDAASREAVAPFVVHSWIAGDYLSALGVPLVKGRWLNDGDRAGTQRVMLVSSRFAERFWPNEDPIGKRARFGADVDEWSTVVGVVGNVKDLDLASDPMPHTYTSIWQVSDEAMFASDTLNFRRVSLVVSSAGDPAVLTRLVRTAMHTIDGQLALGDIRTMEHSVSDTVAERRFTTAIVATFAVAALLLAALGLHGVLAYSVSQRSQEIGIRMALGAAKRDVMRMIFRSGLRMTVLGVAIGLVIAFGATRLMASLLHGISPTDPMTFGMVAALMVGVATIATWLPARQAIGIDPSVAMRE